MRRILLAWPTITLLIAASLLAFTFATDDDKIGEAIGSAAAIVRNPLALAAAFLIGIYVREGRWAFAWIMTATIGMQIVSIGDAVAQTAYDTPTLEQSAGLPGSRPAAETIPDPSAVEGIRRGFSQGTIRETWGSEIKAALEACAIAVVAAICGFVALLIRGPHSPPPSQALAKSGAREGASSPGAHQ